MYSVRGRPARATLDAPNPLLLAGLQRAAHQVGLEVVSEDGSADLSIRSVSSGTPHTRLDIAISDDSVVLSAEIPIDPDVWATIYRLLVEIGGNTTTLLSATSPT